MSLDPDAFRAALGRFATGVTVVTATDAEGHHHGMTVSAFASVSLDPPLVAICIEHGASMHDLLTSTSHFAVNVLSSAQEPIARRFAETGAQRFAGIGYHVGERGVPLIDDVLAWIECDRVALHPGGDHTLIIGETQIATVRDARPLLYYRGGFAQLER
ncbi:MAG TPA: flavin reductase family protein [Candidatus Elarobacter sp.]|nr:flavin reductase family protein [Candidatus Elarobacter sp.]